MTTPEMRLIDSASIGPNSLPAGPLLAYLGDDFTGSTDLMEAFSAAGVSTVLFLSEPKAHWMERFANFRCIGLATTARSQSPEWMDRHLPAAFESLKAFGAPILQYKVCSTFDSSPNIGSIGRAIDIGTRVMGGDWSPMVVGVPRLKRYQAFGNLFAQNGEELFRLDRSPTMSRHPVTPMNEADLRRHLARQTLRRIELIDLVQLRQAELDASGETRRDQYRASDQPVVMFDVLDERNLAVIGEIIWRGLGHSPGSEPGTQLDSDSDLRSDSDLPLPQRPGGRLFSASSSGLQYALAAYWRKVGYLPSEPSLPVASRVNLIAAICGSCSPLTAQQILWAQNHGFGSHRVDIGRALDPECREREIESLVTSALADIHQQRSPLIFSALGPDDPCVLGFERIATQAGKSRAEAAENIGAVLAQVTQRLLARAPTLHRLAVAGGDSSGVIMSALNVVALSVDAALAPGAPLCRAWSEDASVDGLQVVLKGGQMGSEDFFGKVLG